MHAHAPGIAAGGRLCARARARARGRRMRRAGAAFCSRCRQAPAQPCTPGAGCACALRGRCRCAHALGLGQGGPSRGFRSKGSNFKWRHPSTMFAKVCCPVCVCARAVSFPRSLPAHAPICAAALRLCGSSSRGARTAPPRGLGGCAVPFEAAHLWFRLESDWPFAPPCPCLTTPAGSKWPGNPSQRGGNFW